MYPRSGERREKFRQVADEVLERSDGRRAVLTLLMLRGPCLLYTSLSPAFVVTVRF